jgi:ketosteroid isomerase-like protein
MAALTPEQVGQFVRDHFRAKAECDREALSRQFASDVVVWTPLSLTSRGFVDRPTVGADRLIDVIASDYFYARDGREWIVEDYVSDGEKLSVRATLKARVAATGEPYENAYTFFYRLDGNRIAESWEAFDTAFVVDQVRINAADR